MRSPIVIGRRVSSRLGAMPGLLPDIDPDGLLEYSVVYTDRSVNHMSVSFQMVMNDISRVLGDVYNLSLIHI